MNFLLAFIDVFYAFQVVRKSFAKFSTIYLLIVQVLVWFQFFWYQNRLPSDRNKKTVRLLKNSLDNWKVGEDSYLLIEEIPVQPYTDSSAYYHMSCANRTLRCPRNWIYLSVLFLLFISTITASEYMIYTAYYKETLTKYLEWVALFLSCCQLLPQIFKNFKLSSTSGQTPYSILLTSIAQVSHLCYSFAFAVPFKSMILIYFATSFSLVNLLQLLTYLIIDLWNTQTARDRSMAICSAGIGYLVSISCIVTFTLLIIVDTHRIWWSYSMPAFLCVCLITLYLTSKISLYV